MEAKHFWDHIPQNPLEQALMNTGYILYQWTRIDWEELRKPKEYRGQVKHIYKTWKTVESARSLENSWDHSQLWYAYENDAYSHGDYVPRVNSFGQANFSEGGRETTVYR